MDLPARYADVADVACYQVGNFRGRRLLSRIVYKIGQVLPFKFNDTAQNLRDDVARTA